MNDPVAAPGTRTGAVYEADEDDDGLSFFDLLLPLAANWKLLLIGPVLAGAVAVGASYLFDPVFTARTSFLPPQQQQSAAAATLSQLGALAGLASGVAGIKSPADQYIALMRSDTVSDRIVDKFGLMGVYDAKYRVEARKELAENVHIVLGKKDGLITVEVDDTVPKRAADMANQFIVELGRLTADLALTDAQQRRVFFERQLKQTRDRLTDAQQALQSSGFNAGALKAEPKAAAEGYARLRAEITAAEVRLQTLRRSFADGAPEVQQQQTLVSALRGQAARVEEAPGQIAGGEGGADYVGKYREFKYQETLFELFSRQFELARLDESRESPLIQVVDAAAVPERKSKPRRAVVGLLAYAGALLLLSAFVAVRHSWRSRLAQPEHATTMGRVRAAWQGSPIPPDGPGTAAR